MNRLHGNSRTCRQPPCCLHLVIHPQKTATIELAKSHPDEADILATAVGKVVTGRVYSKNQKEMHQESSSNFVRKIARKLSTRANLQTAALIRKYPPLLILVVKRP